MQHKHDKDGPVKNPPSRMTEPFSVQPSYGLDGNYKYKDDNTVSASLLSTEIILSALTVPGC